MMRAQPARRETHDQFLVHGLVWKHHKSLARPTRDLGLVPEAINAGSAHRLTAWVSRPAPHWDWNRCLHAPNLALRLGIDHHHILMQLAETGPVLPMRLGAWVADGDTVASLLDQHERSLCTILNKIGDGVEYAVKLVSGGTDKKTGTGPVPDHGVEAAVQLVHRAFEPLASDRLITTSRPCNPGLAKRHLDASYLVPRAAHGQIEQTTQWLARQLDGSGLSVKVTGPWPAYSFATVRHTTTVA